MKDLGKRDDMIEEAAIVVILSAPVVTFIERAATAIGAIVISGTVVWFAWSIFAAWQKGVLIP
jgi:hypothetical protein